MANQNKNITVTVAGSGELKKLTIPKGTRAKDILKQTGLKGYELFKDGQKLKPGQDVYKEVQEGDELQASKAAVVG